METSDRWGFCVHTKRGHARSVADVIIPAFSSDSGTDPSLHPPPSITRAWSSGLGKAREMACFPINGRNQTAIYLSWPSTAASWRLIHAGHGNSRKELIEERGQAMAHVPLQSGVPAIRQPGLCLQAEVTCSAYPTRSVICTFRYVGYSFQSPTHSRFFSSTHCFHSTRSKVCTCSSTQTDKHCMMMDRTFFPPSSSSFFAFSFNRPVLRCERCLENSSGNM